MQLTSVSFDFIVLSPGMFGVRCFDAIVEKLPLLIWLRT